MGRDAIGYKNLGQPCEDQLSTMTSSRWPRNIPIDYAKQVGDSGLDCRPSHEDKPCIFHL